MITRRPYSRTATRRAHQLKIRQAPRRKPDRLKNKLRGGVMGNDFDSAIARVRDGQMKAVDAAADLVSRLTDEERLWLLDGDQAFWSGIPGMVAKGFSGAP